MTREQMIAWLVLEGWEPRAERGGPRLGIYRPSTEAEVWNLPSLRLGQAGSMHHQAPTGYPLPLPASWDAIGDLLPLMYARVVENNL